MIIWKQNLLTNKQKEFGNKFLFGKTSNDDDMDISFPKPHGEVWDQPASHAGRVEVSVLIPHKHQPLSLNKNQLVVRKMVGHGRTWRIGSYWLFVGAEFPKALRTLFRGPRFQKTSVGSLLRCASLEIEREEERVAN